MTLRAARNEAFVTKNTVKVRLCVIAGHGPALTHVKHERVKEQGLRALFIKSQSKTPLN